MTVDLASPALDGAQRAELEQQIIRARSLLEADLGRQAEGRFGIHPDGTVEEEHALPEEPATRATHRDLVAIVEHLRLLGETRSGAVGRLLREAAFTHLNRLLAIRIAETIGLLPESLVEGRQSQGFKALGEVMPLLADDYWGYLQLCGDELAADVSSLFDPRNPLLELAPSASALDKLVTLLAAPELASAWHASDTLGWAYQFFNTAEERRQMRERGAPASSRDLAVRNQFFTPRYVVDFLVQNTLGRRLLDANPASPLANELSLLVDLPEQPGSALDLDEVAVLDPACGSGHFLLGCYDLLERAYELEGIAPGDAAPRILGSLWGVDIDSRCAQVASAALIFRARRHCRESALPRPNVITARGLPGLPDALPREFDLSPAQRQVAERIGELLADAPVLGVLLRAEEDLERELRHAAFAGRPGTLPLADAEFDRLEAELIAYLRDLAERASSSVAERLVAAEADDAIRLLEAVRKRYDAVLMNPPFGEPVPETKLYLKAAYPWLPTKDSNLLAAFVGRGLELCKPDGYVGAITSRAGMFLTTFERWRREVVLPRQLETLADLGLGVMAQALVEAAAYTIGAGSSHEDHEATFIRLLKDPDREAGLRGAIRAHRAGEPDGRVTKVRVADLDAIPGAPLAYWISPSLRRLFTELPALEGSGAEVRQGLATGEDFRFVRAFWEVDPRRIARTVEETDEGRRWCPFAKGGEYSPFWADVHLAVDWERDGARLRAYGGSRVQNTQYYFRLGLTWPRRTASGFSPRILPAGCVFADKGPGLVADDPLCVLAWLASRPAVALMAASQPAGDETSSGTASKSYEVGLVQRLPWPGPLLDQATLETVAAHADRMVGRRRDQDAMDETTRGFVAPVLPSLGKPIRAAALECMAKKNRDAGASIADSAVIERCFVERLGLTGEAISYLDGELGSHPNSYPREPLEDEKVFKRWFELPIDRLIDEVIDELGGSQAIATMTFVADRRLEVLAHALQRHPQVIAETAGRLGLLPPEQPRRTAADVLSYLVGVAFGRWDVRIGRDRSRASALSGLFDPPQLCPPGMLVGEDGFPAVPAPDGYPLELPFGRPLVDEPGHLFDIEAVVLEAAAALYDGHREIAEELLDMLGRASLREHMRRQFFRDHLARYTKSRRKAPIYWPLTVPSRAWGVWVYAPSLTRETLYAVTGEAARRERLAGETVDRLEREQRAGSDGRSQRRVVEELDREQKLAEELRGFKVEAERVAALGWRPDLDDGLVLCAAPLAELFPSWPDARKARDELRQGKHAWATVAQWASGL